MIHDIKISAALLPMTFFAILATSALVSADAAAPLYAVSKTIQLGPPDRWDYLTFDPVASRIYVAHGDAIDVFDAGSGEPVGKVPVGGSNGVAIVPSLGKGYAGSRTGKSAVVFDLKSLKVLKSIPADEDTDAVIYDDISDRVFIMDGDPHNITVIDTKTDQQVSKIVLQGQPEFAATDGRGKLYVNLADTRQIQRVDTKTASVDATWSIAACDRPHGLSIDRKNNRLFTTCVNGKLLVLDAADGRILATLPIGAGSDASAFDPTRHLVFSSNGSGTLSIIREADSAHFIALDPLPTQVLARTMAINAKTGRIFLVAADHTDKDPKAKDLHKRYAIVPGTAHLLFLDPSPANH